MIHEFLAKTEFIRSLLFTMALLLVSSYYAKKMLLHVLPYAFFRLLLVPGVIIHELSHAIGCILTGAKIETITVFDQEGGSVVHGPPFIKFGGPTIIAMAPIIGGLGMFYFWSHLLNTPYQSTAVSENLISAADIFLSRLGSINWLGWEIWLYFYGCLNLVVAVSPSLEDFKNCKWELIILFLLLGVLEYFSVFNGGNISRNVYYYSTPLILIALFFLLVLLPPSLYLKKSPPLQN